MNSNNSPARKAQWLFIVTASVALMSVAADAMAQTGSSVPVVNSLATFLASMLPLQIVQVVVAFMFTAAAIWMCVGGLKHWGWLVTIFVGGTLAGSASWWANKAVNMGGV